MNNKLITNIDTNLISYAYKEISTEALVQNELLIKELIETIKEKKLYASSEDTIKLIQLTKLEKQLLDLFAELEVNSIDDIKHLIVQFDKQLIKQNEEAKEAKLTAENNLELQKAEYEEKVQELEAEIEQLKIERDRFERKYLGQKNRKVIRFIDKVAK